ncbi:polysaccharide deacetylase family protein [Candidatus Sulfurimonas marisnigri]|uniref:Polysaccharide deacetylase family protein n=1 Tax=Candidatus Sulfurimonas marisnigri TaxID=2740405 RepID=A0A7S7M1S4_9BACT|nr:polysaccharide deacetylase family protein [Candidatus Sulfurimonas marisnigri]QOY55477.1 polysaccharide deacetylase family protein [Candidatus Sulfurimonas marisnigri]
MNLKITLFILLFFLTIPLFANSAVVFMYHRFGESKYPSTNITIEQFKYQLNYLQKNHYNVWPLSKVISYIKNKKTLPPKTVSLTIDDAYISTFTKAYSMLKSKSFPFTVFVSTNQVDSKSDSYMSWEQMREMQKNGSEFANHSLSHEFLLPKENESDESWKKWISAEIQGAEQRLKEELGADVNNQKLFSYPFGEYTMQTAELVRELGYIGITQTSGPVGEESDLMAITRFPMAEAFATSDGFKTKLNTVPMPIETIKPREPFIKENPPKLRIKLKEEVKNIGCYTSNGEAIKVNLISKTEFEISADKELKPPRDKYTCTAQAKDEKWYWHSHFWIVK